MPVNEDNETIEGGQALEPPPDPWAPPRANAAQAASIATGATGVALLAGDMPSGTADSLIAWLPDPHRLLSGAAHLLGLQLNAASVWTWGFLLVVVSLALNVYSFAVRYRWATWVQPRWEAQLEALRRERAARKAPGGGKT